MATVQSEVVAPPPRERFVKQGNPLRTLRRNVDGVVLFSAAYGAYVALGWYTVVRLHIVYGDAESRLTHAYDVFWNQPAKLAALGFVWPPLMSAVFLPFAVVRPVATSLWALPLMSALFGAALLVTLDRALRATGMARWERLPLVLLFGLNPMVAAFSSNGMSEVLAQWLLAAAVVAFIRWYSDRLPQQLVLVGLFISLGTLVRYELALWLVVLVPAIGLATGRRRGLEFEASAIAVLAPVFYALGVWTALNWTILGSPFSWLHEETSQTFQAVQSTHVETYGIAHVTWVVVQQNALVFPMLFVVAAALLVLAVRRRDVMAWALALALLLNVALTIALVVKTKTPHLYELRFNIRTMPLVLLGIGWLYRQTGSRAVWAAGVAGLALTIPLTWHTMRTYRYQLDERNFVAALETGRDQGHRVLGIDPDADRAMARYIRLHVHRRNDVITDDAQTFGVILATGHPELFLDRIDHGDGKWLQAARHPFGRAHYLLVSEIGSDLLSAFYPQAWPQGRGRGLRLVHATRTTKLLAVVGRVR